MVHITSSSAQVITIESQRFNPTSIRLQDDAAHTPRIFGNIETWYYDAIFDNNYSMACVVNVIHFLKTGLILSGVFIYKDNHLLKWVRTRTPMRHFQGSKERPYLALYDKTIIDAEQTQEPKEWTCHVILGDEKNNVDLRFLKKIEGWKGNHFLGDWLVEPRLEVTGNLTVDATKISVSGSGYHDHNNYPLFAPFFGKGANFGKIIAGPIIIVWAQVIRRNKHVDNILVINSGDTLQSVPSNDIQLLLKDSMIDRGTVVPTKYGLRVQKQDIDIDVDIQSLDHHFLTIPAVKYWRHHAKNTGKIRVGSYVEKVDSISIIDQLTFGFQS
jgi:hypothetical protein